MLCAKLFAFLISGIFFCPKINYQLNKKAKTSLVKSGQSYLISIPEVEVYFQENNLTNKEDYLCRMLDRYYS